MAAQPISVPAHKEPARRASVFPARRFHPRRYRPGGEGTWSGHLPFANDLIASLRPQVLVELGTHHGESYFGLCQAVEENNVDCACYAVDTWTGDAHAGFYGESVFENVREYNRAQYAHCSSLVRSTFDDANPQFADGCIDLLHIDGLHTYAAVKADFELWLPKVRPGGIVLFHDINVRHADFEVWKFWEELRESYESFEFHHSWGLGIIRVPGGNGPAPELLALLFTGSREDQQAIREHYAFAADYLELDWRATNSEQANTPKRFLQVFGDRAGVYMENGSARAELQPGAWREYIVELAHGADTSELRLDLADCPCVVELSAIRARRVHDSTLLFQYTAKTELEASACAGDLMPLPGAEHARFLSYGNDPQLLVKAPEGVRLNMPLRVEISMRVLEGFAAAAPSRGSEAQPVTSLETAMIERTLALNRVETMRAELRHEQTERLALLSEFRRLSAGREWHREQLETLQASLASEQDLRVRVENDLAVLRLQATAHALEVTRLEGELTRQREMPAREPLPPVIDMEAVRERDGLREVVEAERAKSVLLQVDVARLESELGQARKRTAELTDDRLYLQSRLNDDKLLSATLASDHEAARQQVERDLAFFRAGFERLQLESARIAALETAAAESQLRMEHSESRLREAHSQLVQAEANGARERVEWNTRIVETEQKHAQAMLVESARLHHAALAERAGRDEILRSYSWRITAPFRAMLGIVTPRR